MNDEQLIDSIFEDEDWSPAEIITHLQAEDVIRKLKYYEAQLADVQKNADDYVARAKERADAYLAQNSPFLKRQIAACTQVLRTYTEQQLTGNKRSLKLVEGTLSLKKTRDHYIHDDKAILAQVATDPNFKDYIAYEPKLLWNNLKNDSVVNNGKMFLNGHEITGVTVEQDLPDTFTVKIND